MKKLFYLCIALVGMSASAQVGIGVPTADINASAQLEVSSTSKGFLAPRMTQAQKNNISSPAAGLLVYQTDAPSGFYYFDGSIWQSGLGPQGATGPMGPQGIQGIAGATGAQGLQGVAGNDGLDGATGPMGPQGIQGVAGPIGAQGPAGNDGLDGATGPMGPQGEVGMMGPQGEMGPAGIDGVAGVPGPLGDMGPQGPQGVPGIAGATGSQGLQGVAGNDGLDGATGPMGPIGPQGPAGIDGVAGVPGPQGEMGPQGVRGFDGPPGPQGVAGHDGFDGAPGPQGDQGPIGPQGEVGPQGEPGTPADLSGYATTADLTILQNQIAALTTSISNLQSQIAQFQNSGSFTPTVISGTMSGVNAEYFVVNNVVFVTGNFSNADFDGDYAYVDLNIPVMANFTNASDVNGSVLGMFFESASGYVEAIPNTSTVRLKVSGAHGFAFGTNGSFVYSYKLPGASSTSSYAPTLSSGNGTFSNANYVVNGNIVLVNGNFSNAGFDPYGMYVDINLPVSTTFVDSFDASGIVSGRMEFGESVSGYVEAIPGTNTVRLRAAGAHGFGFNTTGSYVFSYKISSSNNSQSYIPTVLAGQGSFTVANYSTVGNVEYVSGNFSNAEFDGSGMSVDITIPGNTFFTNASDVNGSVSGIMAFGESVSGYVEAIPNTNTVRLRAAGAHMSAFNTTGSFIFSYSK